MTRLIEFEKAYSKWNATKPEKISVNPVFVVALESVTPLPCPDDCEPFQSTNITMYGCSTVAIKGKYEDIHKLLTDYYHEIP